MYMFFSSFLHQYTNPKDVHNLQKKITPMTINREIFNLNSTLLVILFSYM